jgi:hypothetical protein
MKHFCKKPHLGGLVGVVFSEFQDQFEGSTFPGSIVGTKDNSLPQHNVRVHWSACHSGRRVILEPIGRTSKQVEKAQIESKQRYASSDGTVFERSEGESKKSTQLLRGFPYKVYGSATKYPLSPDVMVEVTPFSEQVGAMRARFSRSYRLKSLRRRRLALVLISKW